MTNVEQDDPDFYLRSQISILLMSDLDFKNTSAEFQLALEKRFGTRYDLMDILNQLEILWIENEAKQDQELQEAAHVAYPDSDLEML